MALHYSLKRRLIWYTSIFSILLGCVLIFSAYKIALQESNQILDAQMQYLAKRAATQPYGAVVSHFEKDRVYREEDLFVDIWAYKDQSHLSHADRLLVPPVKYAGFYTQQTDHGIWRTYVMPTKDFQIQISQQEKVRQVMALELAGSMFLPYVIILPFALIGLAGIIRRSLKPLDDFKSELIQRDSNDLAPIHEKDYPEELSPTIHEMNRLFERISTAQQEQKQFVADAAHELRTPITALNLQTKILLSQFPDHAAFQNLSKGLARIQHLVSQLLALAKQDASMSSLERFSTFQLNNVALNCVEQLMNLAMEKEIDLGFERNEDIEMVSIEPTVHSIIFNLIDNAIKYTPVAGVINISVYEDENSCACVQIEDSGAGIDPQYYDQVLKRFYRVHHHLEVGSGLGLSIVDKATQRLGGQLILSQSIELGGLSILVCLPKILKS
ncbi:hypothetical protein F942_01570 [Acinetobacter ursingii ANC 3649]|uniref:histidine kinase n=2 Tax=Acinetobacter TaxID=469 RepID=N9DH36_9GAMM|nr:hypothetical protein F942_01570 [Acinetobacter ursingii ANC 3649]QXZ23014.1 two-component sensor histidine kinase [Acinetobacter septicus]